MIRVRSIVLAFASLSLAAASAFAQSPFEEIHGDILRKMEARKAQGSPAFRPQLAPQPTPNQLLYDVIHYTVDIAVDPATKLIEGTVTVIFTGLGSPLSSIDLDADDVLAITDVRGGNDASLGWVRSPGLVSVTLPAAVSAGDTGEVEIVFGGYPNLSADPGLFFTTFAGNTVVYSLSEPWSARAWWPCKDYPDDKATFDLYFSVPASLVAASNGAYLGYTEETRWAASYRRYHWREGYPMSTYLASIAASNYTILTDDFVYAPGDTMPVTHFVHPSIVANALIDLDITVPSLAFFSEIFGLYPFVTEKYGVALSPIGGGMEHQTLTTYGSYLIQGTHYYDWIFVHELAHMWFGDMITCENWVHIWLNEGFASYAEALWFEHLQGASKLKSYMEAKDRPSRWTGPILRDPDNTDPWYYFDDVVYNKAAWVLHMLRHVVGDEKFFQILRDYTADPRYRFKVADTDDFRALCEARHGESLEWFFTEWLTREDRLVCNWTSTAYRLGDVFNVTIAVEQVQADLYTMPVDFRIVTAAGVVDTALWIDDRHEEYHLVFADSVLDVACDPDHWILGDRNEITTDTSAILPVAFLDQNFPNPFNPQTTLRFGLREPAHVLLQIFDARGALVATLAREERPAGIFDVAWNGADDRGRALRSGIYFCRLRAGTRDVSRKMILMR